MPRIAGTREISRLRGPAADVPACLAQPGGLQVRPVRFSIIPGLFLAFLPVVSLALSDFAQVRLADGFDFPVGKPNGDNYYKARGYRPNAHLGEDWNGGPGDSDIGLPVFSIGGGIVVLARDVRLGWGNVVIVRHAYLEGGRVAYIDSLYGHLNDITVAEGQTVLRGQKVGTIGNCRGRYDAHLHFEIRKNLAIGMNRAQFARDFSNYFDPTRFIEDRRALPTGPGVTNVALNTFAPPAATAGGGTMRFATGSEPGQRTRVIARKGTFKVNRYSDMDL